MDTLQFQTIPANSVFLLPEQARAGYLSRIIALPRKVRDILFAADTGSYITGLAKSYDISLNLAPKLSFGILTVILGEKNLLQFTGTLSTELQLPTDQAQRITAEIQKDVFGPIQAELDQFLQQQKSAGKPPVGNTRPVQPSAAPKPAAAPIPPHQGVPNLLNLKELNAGKQPVRLPPRQQVALPPKPTPPPVPKVAPSPKPPVSPIKPLDFT